MTIIKFKMTWFSLSVLLIFAMTICNTTPHTGDVDGANVVQMEGPDLSVQDANSWDNSSSSSSKNTKMENGGMSNVGGTCSKSCEPGSHCVKKCVSKCVDWKAQGKKCGAGDICAEQNANTHQYDSICQCQYPESCVPNPGVCIISCKLRCAVNRLCREDEKCFTKSANFGGKARTMCLCTHGNHCRRRLDKDNYKCRSQTAPCELNEMCHADGYTLCKCREGQACLHKKEDGTTYCQDKPKTCPKGAMCNSRGLVKCLCSGKQKCMYKKDDGNYYCIAQCLNDEDCWTCNQKNNKCGNDPNPGYKCFCNEGKPGGCSFYSTHYGHWTCDDDGEGHD